MRALGCSGLASTQVAAGLRPRGFSGSPVLVRTPSGPVVVGVLRWMQEDDDAERAVGGVVYATRVSDLTTTWPSLRTPDPVRELAGDMLAPFRAEIEDFLSAQIRGPDGELPFAGRVRELDELDSWLDDPDGSAYHLVAGPAGIGKSAVLTRWTLSLARRDGVVALIVPISIRFDLTAERDVLLALYHRLAQVHRDSADRTASTADARQGVRDYLERPAPAGQVVVVLDALDEVAGWTPGRRLLPVRPGRGVRILLSARVTADNPTGAAWADRLGLPRAAPVTTLTPLGSSTMSELVGQVRPAETPGAVAAAGERLWGLTAGDPVTVALYLAELRENESLPLAEWITDRHTPPGLEGFFEGWWRGQVRLWEDAGRADDAERVLGLLSCAEGPLRRADLRELVGRLPEPLDGVRLTKALVAVRRFALPGDGTDETIVIAHPTITQMLRRRLTRDATLAEYRDAYLGWGADTLAGLRAGTLDPAAVSVYLVRHLAQHLTATDKQHAAALDLTSPVWRRTHDAVASPAVRNLAEISVRISSPAANSTTSLGPAAAGAECGKLNRVGDRRQRYVTVYASTLVSPNTAARPPGSLQRHGRPVSARSVQAGRPRSARVGGQPRRGPTTSRGSAATSASSTDRRGASTSDGGHAGIRHATCRSAWSAPRPGPPTRGR